MNGRRIGICGTELGIVAGGSKVQRFLMERPTKTILAFTHGKDHPSARLRILQYKKFWAQHGWQLKTHVFWPPPVPPSFVSGLLTRFLARLAKAIRTLRVIAAFYQYRNCDAVLVSREVPAALLPFLRHGRKLIVDVDDAVYLGSERKNFERLCRDAKRVVAGNATLAAAASDWNPAVSVIPTVVDTACYLVKSDYSLPKRARVGWIGSEHSIYDTLFPVLPCLASLQKTLDFELVVISRPRPKIEMSALDWCFIEWSPDVEKRLADFMDIGIMPLEDNDYQRAKCGAKLLQYMAAGIPVVASPVGVNASIVQQEQSGLYARCPEEWKSALTRLIEGENLRAHFGKAGRKRVCDHFSVDRWGVVWNEILDEMAVSE